MHCLLISFARPGNETIQPNLFPKVGWGPFAPADARAWVWSHTCKNLETGVTLIMAGLKLAAHGTRPRKFR